MSPGEKLGPSSNAVLKPKAFCRMHAFRAASRRCFDTDTYFAKPVLFGTESVQQSAIRTILVRQRRLGEPLSCT
jgi:hypothetical protein